MLFKRRGVGDESDEFGERFGKEVELLVLGFPRSFGDAGEFRLQSASFGRFGFETRRQTNHFRALGGKLEEG